MLFFFPSESCLHALIIKKSYFFASSYFSPIRFNFYFFLRNCVKKEKSAALLSHLPIWKGMEKLQEKASPRCMQVPVRDNTTPLNKELPNSTQIYINRHVQRLYSFFLKIYLYSLSIGVVWESRWGEGGRGRKRESNGCWYANEALCQCYYRAAPALHFHH